MLTWESPVDDWKAALGCYNSNISRLGSEQLEKLEKWYIEELPAAIRKRKEPYITKAELEELMVTRSTQSI